MAQRRQVGADALDVGAVDGRGDEPFALRALRNDIAPGINDRALAVGAAAAGVAAPLPRGNDVGLAFDGPGAQEDVPMIFARGERERRRHDDDLGSAIGELAIELRETEAVSDREPDGEPTDGNGERLD